VLGVSGTAGVEKALTEHRDYVMTETLATEWQTNQANPIYSADRELADESWKLEFAKS